jgi:protein-tyrosine kinase
MSLIEEASKRLEQLRQAGVDIPESVTSQSPAIQANTTSNQQRVDQGPDRAVGTASIPVSKPELGDSTLGKHVKIDLTALETAGYITPNTPKNQLADECRVLKRPLISNAIGKGAALVEQGNLIMITSALPGEGKTFTAINLAISMAMEMDTTVMLVDADVAKPSLLKVLGLPPQPGFLDVISDEKLNLSDVLLRTNIDKLTILPSGNPHPRATELLASDAMVMLLDEMASRYPDRIIIFDSPPLLLTTESRVLASHMGQVVLVTAAERTMQGQVKQALAMIDACPVKLLILNRARPGPLDRYGYGHGYGYGYGYGQQHAN